MWIPILHNFECHKGKIAMLKISTQESEAFILLCHIFARDRKLDSNSHLPLPSLPHAHCTLYPSKEEGRRQDQMVDLTSSGCTDICSERSAHTEYSKYLLFPYCTSALFHSHLQCGLEVLQISFQRRTFPHKNRLFRNSRTKAHHMQVQQRLVQILLEQVSIPKAENM